MGVYVVFGDIYPNYQSNYPKSCLKKEKYMAA